MESSQIEQPLISKLLNNKRVREEPEYKRLVYVCLDYVEIENIYIAVCLRYMFDDDNVMLACVNEDVDYTRLRLAAQDLKMRHTYPWWVQVVLDSHNLENYLEKINYHVSMDSNTQFVKGIRAVRDLKTGEIQIFGTDSLVGNALEEIFAVRPQLFKLMSLKELSQPNPFKTPEKYMSSVELNNLKQFILSISAKLLRLKQRFPSLKTSFLVTLPEWQSLVALVRYPSFEN